MFGWFAAERKWDESSLPYCNLRSPRFVQLDWKFRSRLPAAQRQIVFQFRCFQRRKTRIWSERVELEFFFFFLLCSVFCFFVRTFDKRVWMLDCCIKDIFFFYWWSNKWFSSGDLWRLTYFFFIDVRSFFKKKRACFLIKSWILWQNLIILENE